MLVWRRAMRLPTVIVSAASTHIIGPYDVVAAEEADEDSSMMATKPAAFDATDRNAVIGVGAPS